jgi:hypothetical protein
MKETDPSYDLKVLSTDRDAGSLDYGRKLAYDAEWFTPILGEGGNQDRLRDRWFTVHETEGKKVYMPSNAATKGLSFERFDISEPQVKLNADIIFCQNVLIHMKPKLAEKCLRNVLNILKSPSVLVCAGMDLDLKGVIVQSGLRPVADSIQEIHESWCSHRAHYRNDPGKYYFELEDMDTTRKDWLSRYSSIFVRN